MILKYVGPKPIISHTGIEFDNNKEDKYAYLNIVIQLIRALDHEYIENRIYKYEADTRRLDDEDLLGELRKYCPDIENLTSKQNHNIEDEIQHHIERANESVTLSDEDKEVLKKNIDIMHDYMVQRSINKSVYYCAINYLANLLKRDHIDYIVTPMFQPFAHTLHSLQGVLRELKEPISTNLEIYQEEKKLLIKLQVINTI